MRKLFILTLIIFLYSCSTVFPVCLYNEQKRRYVTCYVEECVTNYESIGYKKWNDQTKCEIKYR